MLKTIRTEMVDSVPGACLQGHNYANDFGVDDPQLARALQQLSVGNLCGGGHSQAPASSAEKDQAERDGGGAASAVAATPHEGGEGVARAQGQLQVAAYERSINGCDARQKVQPSMAFSGDLKGWSNSPSDAPPPSAGRARKSGLQSERIVAGAGEKSAEAGTGSGHALAAVPDILEGEQSGDASVKSVVEKLLRTSSSVALAAARPLSIKPPPVLEVEEDPHQVMVGAHTSIRLPVPQVLGTCCALRRLLAIPAYSQGSDFDVAQALFTARGHERLVAVW